MFFHGDAACECVRASEGTGECFPLPTVHGRRMIAVPGTSPKMPRGTMARRGISDHAAQAPPVKRNAVEKIDQRVGAGPTVSGQLAQSDRSGQLLIPRGDFAENSVFLASVRRAPSQEAQPIPRVAFMQRKPALGGRAQVPDGQHRGVDHHTAPAIRGQWPDERMRGDVAAAVVPCRDVRAE